MASSPQRWLNGLLAGIFAVLITAPGLVTFLPRKPSAAGGGEHRQLAPSPTWAWRKEAMLAFPRGFDAWFQDHFGFRDAFIRAHALLMYKVLHTTPSARVMLGRDKYLFYNGAAIKDGDPIADYRGHRPLTPLQLETWRWYFEERLGRPVPDDLAAYAARFGLDDEAALLRAVQLERWSATATPAAAVTHR